jgi:two-component system nitrate/nitrite response regulator NarL
MTSILIADDHAFLRAGLEAVLGSLGYRIVASVADGAAALAAIDAENPDLVILDIRMPQRSGVEVLEALRAKGDTRPVLLLTAELDNPSLVGAVRAKVDGIVFKDNAAGTLQQAIETVLAGGRFIDIALMDRAFMLATEAPSRSALDTLSDRDQRIVEGAAAGMRNKDIADGLGITEGSVKVYLHRIYEKLGVSNRTELALLVHRT